MHFPHLHFPHFHLPEHSLFTVLVGYINHIGQFPQDADQLRTALTDINGIISYSQDKMDIAIDADAAEQISNVGLQWLDYAKQNPDNPKGFADQAKQLLDDTPPPADD